MSVDDFYWDFSRLEDRLRSIGLNPRRHFGDLWDQEFEDAFNKRDRLLARSALQAKSTEYAWIIDVGSASDLLPTTDYTVCADSIEDALSWLLSRATSENFFPDSVQFDPVNEAIHFKVRGKSWARVLRQKPAPQSEATRSRAASTVRGLRGHPRPGDELLRRLRRWPGCSTIEALDVDELAADVLGTHIPDPTEWRLSAKLFLQQMGLNSDEKSIQQLICAVFDAPSWNHLSAAVTKYQSAGSQPCAVLAADPDGADELIGVYADYLDAFPHFLYTAAARGASWPAMHLEILDNHGSPSYYLRKPVDDANERWSAPRVVLCILDKVTDDDDDQRNRLVVSNMVATEGCVSEALLEEMFMIGRPLAVRTQLVESVGRLRLIAEDSGWRFHECLDRHEQYLMVERVDASGNRIHRAVFVPYRKAQIHLVQSAGLYAITGEYNGRQPEAVVSISPATAERVAQALPEMRVAFRRWHEASWGEADKRAFARLADQARNFGQP